MKVSILIPSRGRIDNLIKSIDSIVNTANSLDNFELLIRFDNDDYENINSFVEYNTKNYKEFPIKIFIGKRWGYELLHKYYNELSKMSTGNLLWLWNDDLMMRTKYWDIILKSSSDNGNKFALFNPWTNHILYTHKMDWYWGQSLFPIIPKKWFDTTGRWSSCHSVDTPVQIISHSLKIFEYVDIYVEHLRVYSDLNIDENGNSLKGNKKGRELHNSIYDINNPLQWNNVYEHFFPLIISDIFILNEKFNLIDNPVQGQLPNKSIPIFEKYKNLRSID